MILIIDNYDSFVYNIRDYVAGFGYETRVVRNNQITPPQVKRVSPTHIIISPGPCTPNETGNTKEIIKAFAGKIPILGICLGHQTIAEVYGAKVKKAKKAIHGKTSEIFFTKSKLFTGIQPPSFTAVRYHSLIVESVPEGFKEIAWCCDGSDSNDSNDSSGINEGSDFSDKTTEKIMMGIENEKLKVYGLQFHPESILTREGKKILKNFLK